eukprot:14616767-Ditylum_brightwellii.AAC.1
MVGEASTANEDKDSITISGKLSKVKAQHAILGTMPVTCTASATGIKVQLAKLGPVLEGALASKGAHYEKACSYKE